MFVPHRPKLLMKHIEFKHKIKKNIIMNQLLIT